MNSFLPPHAYLGSWQTTNFGEKILKTLEDARFFATRNQYIFFQHAHCIAQLPSTHSHKLSQVYLTRGRLVGRIHFSIDSGLRSFILFFSGGLTYYPQTDENKLKQEYPSCGMCKTWQIRPDTSWRHTSKQIVNNVSFASQYDWVLEKQDPGRVDTCQDLGK